MNFIESNLADELLQVHFREQKRSPQHWSQIHLLHAQTFHQFCHLDPRMNCLKKSGPAIAIQSSICVICLHNSPRQGPLQIPQTPGVSTTWTTSQNHHGNVWAKFGSKGWRKVAPFQRITKQHRHLQVLTMDHFDVRRDHQLLTTEASLSRHVKTVMRGGFDRQDSFRNRWLTVESWSWIFTI